MYNHVQLYCILYYGIYDDITVLYTCIYTAMISHSAHNVSVQTTHSSAHVCWLPAFDAANKLHHVLWSVSACATISLQLTRPIRTNIIKVTISNRIGYGKHCRQHLAVFFHKAMISKLSRLHKNDVDVPPYASMCFNCFYHLLCCKDDQFIEPCGFSGSFPLLFRYTFIIVLFFFYIA